tara:strand:+ start:9347 stop:11686 length:2340 start_codon:yes stop_codon:yes gene_type:complete
MEFLTYIAKSAGILTLFYVVYVLVLRKDTFFTANRTFLLVGILSALLLPFVTLTTITFVEAPIFVPTEGLSELTPMQGSEAIPVQETIDIWQLVLGAYCIGLAVMAVRFGAQLFSLFNLLRKHPSKKANGFHFIEITDKIAPFSFFSYIVFNPETHEQQELEMILQHEKVHAAQWHSIDVLLSNMIRALQWINPVSWLYKKSIEANLEFLADHQTASCVPSKTDYQLTLLKALSPLPVPALTNNFYHSFIKKRIIMLNKSNSNKYNQLKLILVLPALALFLWSFNTEEVIEYTTPPTKASVEENKTHPSENSVLRFSATSTDTELNALENYFATNHPESLVKIAARKRDASGNLINFSFQTKFTGNKRFYTRFDRGEATPFKTIYTINMQEDGGLLVSELGNDEVQFKITKEQLVFLTKDGLVTPDSKNVTTKTSNKITKPVFGVNPLYIINGKEYRKNQLPTNKTIELDGIVEAFNKEEGKEKYGEKGKDGVLFFNGVSTFKEVEETVSEKNTRELSKAETKPSVKEIRIKITKNTTKDELEVHKKELKELHDVDFNYSSIAFNNKGEITSISITYSGHGNNGTYTITSDDGEPIDDFYFYMDTEKGVSGVGSKEKELQMEQRMAMMEQRRARMETRKEVLRNSSEIRKELLEERRENMSEVRSELAETRKELRKEAEEMRKAEAEIARTSSRMNTNSNGTVSNRIIITKNTTDAQLKTMKAALLERGVDFNYKRVKRNSNGEITSIIAKFDNGKGSKVSKSIQTDDGEAINTIVVNM